MGEVKAGELVNRVATRLGGKGGGRPDMAMAGATDVAGVPQALASVKPWVWERVAAKAEAKGAMAKKAVRKVAVRKKAARKVAVRKKAARKVVVRKKAAENIEQ